jgi:2-methylcitrate dehydratase PrpD
VNPASLSLDLCKEIASWRYHDLPAPVLRMVKLCLADTLAVIGGGTRAAGIPELNARMARWESGGAATGLVGRRRFSPPTAALVNGAAAHALDYDDIHDAARVHSGCVVLPAVLATAEDLGGVSGKDFLLALAVGTELHARLGLACFNSLARGWHPTAIFGAMAAALAAGRLRGLDAQGLNNALGIAYHQAAGSAQSAYDGVLSKRLGPGFAARDAVTAAALAADGLTGTRAALEGKAGFLALYMQGEVRPAHLTDGLGTQWRIEEYSLKPYPACRCSHGAIALGITLFDEGIAPGSVAGAEIRLSEANWSLVSKPYEVALDSVVQAQFSAAYSFARALTDGTVGPNSYERPAINDPAVAALAGRVRVQVDLGVAKDAMAPVGIRVTLTDGRVLDLAGDTLKGSREQPMTDREVQAKLRGCFAFGLDAPAAAADRVADAVFGLEYADDAAAAIRAAFPGP